MSQIIGGPGGPNRGGLGAPRRAGTPGFDIGGLSSAPSGAGARPIVAPAGGAGVPGGAAESAVKETTTASFMTDVIEASLDGPIVVDFWAPWCGPCKQLGPVLEKVIAATKGAVRMVKLNIDENPELAQQMRIQSIPAVYAFVDGRPVDGFMGAVPESQVKSFVQKLATMKKDGPGAALQEAIDLAQQALGDGDFDTAGELFQQILQHQPDHLTALVGLARVALGNQDVDLAKEIAASIPEADAKNQEVISLRSAIELAGQAGEAAEGLRNWEQRLAQNEADHDARVEYANALFALGRREDAVDQLLVSFKADRDWNEQAARKLLLKFFEALGPMDPLAIAGRKRLSSLMFS